MGFGDWDADELEKRAVSLGPDGAAEVLRSVRARAEAWIKGTAAVLTLVMASLVVTDVRETIHLFAPGARQWLAGLLVGSASLGLLSLWFSIRAAHGPAWLDTRMRKVAGEAIAERDLRRARGAAQDLRNGQWSLTIAAVLLIALVASTWVLPLQS